MKKNSQGIATDETQAMDMTNMTVCYISKAKNSTSDQPSTLY